MGPWAAQLSLWLGFQSTGQSGNEQWCLRSPAEGNRNKMLSWQREPSVQKDSLNNSSLCFLSAQVFSPGFWLGVINTAGHSTPTRSSDVTVMLCIHGAWEAWAAWCSLCPFSTCSTASAVPELWNSPMFGSSSLIWMCFFQSLNVVSLWRS